MADVFKVRCGCGAIYSPIVRTQRACSACESKRVAQRRDQAVAESFGLDVPGVVVERVLAYDGTPQFVAMIDAQADGDKRVLRLNVPAARKLLAGQETAWRDVVYMHKDFDWGNARIDGRVLWPNEATGSVQLIAPEERARRFAERDKRWREYEAQQRITAEKAAREQALPETTSSTTMAL